MATVTVSTSKPQPVFQYVLLLLALAMGVGGYILTSLNRTGALPANLGVHIALLVALGLGGTLLVRYFAPYADPVILPLAVGLTGLGLAMIYRIDMAYTITGEPVVGIKQLILVGVGLTAAFVVLIVIRDHRVLRKYTFTAMFVSILLLLSPFIPGLGRAKYGAKIWISLGPFSLQPAEFVKITLAVFFAGYLVANRDSLAVGGPKVLGIRLPRIRDLGPILVVWGISVIILVMQRDLGTSLLYFGLFVAMIYVATNRTSWIILGGLLFIPAALVATKLFSHVGRRVNIWLNAFDPEIYDMVGGSHQVVQGQFGMASGGLFGTGWGLGYPNLVPFANSDFILASLAEELGLTGLMAILLMYLILIERGFRAAIGVRDGFGKLLAVGISFSLALQLFVVLGGITRLIPLTGLTAPFLAQGGSSMVSSWIAIALLLRISDAARRPTPLPVNDAGTEKSKKVTVRSGASA
ncbi:FtsW/RodA/SpoVE family cell cycle protein [Gleimia sp. 6138-11-ORH1]|uniref:FtsW/RodA/SpoVE family cell cycle protein n=1 Tax=Gleimia sp. 6138-11-ORH1 TaxID=2973937 RepID=UPI00216787F1|nr:FtsW/RodA/SpoVE family cell cycle protein [Gleimia sp. 6138-11-ORH1]MCS4485109.1 FtsW/RodA/SpoVE family cell cycle protein [Gleimia sp. 6138-11-ORH1]